MTNKQYLNIHYPRLYPCNSCFYWRGQSSGYPMCEYILDTGEPRGCEPDFINKKCDKYKPKQRKKSSWGKYGG